MPNGRDRSSLTTNPTGPLATQVDGAFAKLEQRAERILAGLRLLALLVLALVFRVVGTIEQGYPTMVPLGGLTQSRSSHLCSRAVASCDLGCCGSSLRSTLAS